MRKLTAVNGLEVKKLEVGSYPASPMAMWVRLEYEDGEQDILTFNLGNYQVGYGPETGPFASFIQTATSYLAELPQYMIDWIYENGIAEPYCKFGQPVSADFLYESYPLFSFNEDLLRELDPIGYRAYEQAWNEECFKQQKQLRQHLYG